MLFVLLKKIKEMKICTKIEETARIYVNIVSLGYNYISVKMFFGLYSSIQEKNEFFVEDNLTEQIEEKWRGTLFVDCQRKN